MLDLNHPQTPSVFAASTQLDFILEDCKRMTLIDSRGRQFRLENIRPAFAALRWLAHERFADVPQLPAAIDELERQAARLAELPLRRAEPWVGQALPCPACEAVPIEPNEYDSIRYCSQCLDTIMPGLMRVRSLEEGFRTEAI